MAQTKSRFARCPGFFVNSPAFVLKFCLSLALGLVLAAAARAEKPTPAPAAGQAASPAPEKKKKDKDKEAGEEGKGQFDFPVQKGEPVKGIRIPHYGEDGKLQMMFDAEEAVKIDDTHVKLKNLKIDATGEDDKKFYVELPESIFDLETRVLNGENRVLVRREDFEITGDSGEFYIKTRFAKVKGNVKMIIYSTEDLNNP